MSSFDTGIHPGDNPHSFGSPAWKEWEYIRMVTQADDAAQRFSAELEAKDRLAALKANWPQREAWADDIMAWVEDLPEVTLDAEEYERKACHAKGWLHRDDLEALRDQSDHIDDTAATLTVEDLVKARDKFRATPLFACQYLPNFTGPRGPVRFVKVTDP